MPLWGWHLANRTLSPEGKQLLLSVAKRHKTLLQSYNHFKTNRLCYIGY